MPAQSQIINLKALPPEKLWDLKAARWKARTDLGWLCRNILGFEHVTDNSSFPCPLEDGPDGPLHQPIIDALQKFPIPTPEQFDKNDRVINGKWVYTPITPLTKLPGSRRVLILDPRGFLKTTINIVAHTIQWIINYPDITIMIIQSNGDKARDFLKKIKLHFQGNDKFRKLFPEHCPHKAPNDWGTQDRFTTEARSGSNMRAEATVMATSIDKGAAGYHVDVMKFSDIVDQTNISGNGINMVKDSFYMMQNLLVGPNYWIDVEGTRYAYCLDGDTGITMSDWSQKPIKDINVGDEVVGWKLENNRRWLKKSKVIAKGSHIDQTYKYTLASGKTIICTEDHKFWRGKQWQKNCKNKEYSPIKSLKSLRRLIHPIESKLETYDAGWLAGIYDGEGSFHKNTNHPSATLQIYQTLHNPKVVDEIRDCLTRLNFSFREGWFDPSRHQKTAHHKDRCTFSISNWQDRYKFLREIQPVRNQAKLAESLFGAMCTTSDEIIEIEDAGWREVFWFQCETGNYIADGLCSKNSDLYGEIIKHELAQPLEKRIYKIHARPVYEQVDDPPPTAENLEKPFKTTSDGRFISRWPRRFSIDHLEDMGRRDPMTFATQQLNSPARASLGGRPFPVEAGEFERRLIPIANFRQNVRVAYKEISIDCAYTIGHRSDFTAIVVGTFDHYGRCYVEEIEHGRFLPDEINMRVVAMIIKHYSHLKCLKIENAAFTHGMLPGLRRLLDTRNLHVQITLIPRENDKSKEDRILKTLQPWYKSCDLRFVDNLNPDAMKALKLEMAEFPSGSHDDILDAVSDLFQDKEWFGRETPQLMSAEERQHHFGQKTRELMSKEFDRMLGLDVPYDPDYESFTPTHPYYSKTGGL